MKRFFFDVETTGLNPENHCIHQLSAIIEIDGDIKEMIDYKIRPDKDITPAALEVSGVTLDKILQYEEPANVFSKLTTILNKYCDRFNKTDKFHLVGYNNGNFDNKFLRAFWQDNYFGAYFWSDSLDVMMIASLFLQEQRQKMVNFKLHTVAKAFGLEVDESQLHDAMYDVNLTRDIFHICNNKLGGNKAA